MWYTGNVKVSSEDLEKKTFDNFAHWARKLGMRGEKCLDNGKKSMNGDVTHHAPTRITWENPEPAGCVNEAYDRSSDAPPNEKTVELEILKNSE
ncbi:hypothetical protein M9458_025574, partial [Cirrhinus mrigala]